MSVSPIGVTQRYGATPSLHHINLEVAEGEFLALVGPSGAGKTTVLRVIAGLESRFTGTLRIGGRDMAGVAARHRNVGFVFQNYALFRHMSVAENVGFGLKVRRRLAKAEIRSRVNDLLELVQIPHLAERRPAQLSGGQQQRVALARALATSPQLMLMDEPFGALDPLVRKDIRTWLRELHTRLGLTSVFITHDQGEAIELADRVAVMRAGRILQIGPADELEAAPLDPFVFEFLGPTVRLEGTVHGGMMVIDDLPVRPFRIAAAPGPAMALCRPHQLVLAPGEGDGVIVRTHRSGPLFTTVVEVRGRTLELVAATEPPATGTRCGLALVAAKVFTADGAASVAFSIARSRADASGVLN